MKFSAWYGFLIGLLMLGQWSFSIVAGAVREFNSAPLALAFHLFAEMATALMLIAGGIATLRSRAWGRQVLLVGLGMVIYSEIVSPGYFAEQGQWSSVAMFVALLAGAVVSLVLLLKPSGGLART